MNNIIIFSFLVFLTTYVHFSDSAALRQKRDLKDELLMRAERLLFIASGEAKLLREEKRDIEVKGLEQIEAQLIEFQLLLRTATNQMEIMQLELALRAIEDSLDMALDSVGKDHISSQELDSLVSRASKLVDTATAEVKRLKAQNRGLTAAGVEQELVRLINLVLDLKTAKKSEEIRRLAEVLIQIETNLTELLADLSKTKRRKRQADPVREQVIRRAADLEARVTAEIALLRALNRTNDITVLQREETAIQQLVRQLNATTNQNQVRQIEQQLVEAENRLDAELTRLEATVVNTTERDAIIRRAEELNARAAAAVAQLRQDGRSQLAAQLQLEESTIAELVRQLRAARTGQEIRQLEQRLVQAENRLETELNSITATVADPEKDALIKRADNVTARVTAEVSKLKTVGRTQEAATLESDQRLIAELVTELKGNASAAEVTRVKTSLNQTLTRVEAELKQLESTATSDPERDALLKRAADLKTKADTLVYKLKGESKELEAELVSTQLLLVNEVVSELTNAIVVADITRLKASLKADLDKLEQTITNLDRPVNNELLRTTLTKTAQDLDTKAKDAIAKLKAAGKSADQTAELERIEKLITGLIADIKAANTTEALRKLEDTLKTTETSLNAEIQKQSTSTSTPLSDTEIQTLIKKAEDLALKSKTAIRSLVERGRLLEAEGLDLEVQGLVVLDVMLRTATPEEAAGLALQLAEIEKRVEQQLSQISAKRRKRQAVLTAQLLKRAEDLAAKANAEIAALKAANNAAEVSLLQSEEAAINELVTQLKNSSGLQVLELVSIEQKLIDAENKLDDELRKLQQQAVQTAERDAIIKKAEELNARAAAEITKLRTEGRALLAEQLQNEEEVISELVQQLKAARTGSDIKQLEQKLNETEKKLADELSKITHAISDPERDDLLKRAETVSANTTATINKLKADNRTQEVATFQSEQRLISELVDQLKRANESAEINRAKQALKEDLDRLEGELKKVQNIVPVDQEKEDLLKRATNLANRTTTQIYRLKSEGKDAEAATLGAEQELIDLLVDQLTTSKDAAEVQRVKDRLKEKLDKLEGEIKKLEDTISDPERDQLVKRAEALRNRTTANVEKLRGLGNATEAAALENERDVIDALAKEASNANRVDEIKRLKDSLKAALDKLEKQLMVIEDTPIVDAEKEALLKRADTLRNRTTAEVNKLKGANQTAQATALEAQLELVAARVDQLKAAMDPADLTKTKTALKQTLDKLEDDVKKLEDTPLPDPEKDALLARAANATKQVNETGAKLRTQDRAQEAATLEAELKLVAELVTELNKTSADSAELKRLKDSLKSALDKLDTDLAAAAKPLIDEALRNQLVNRTAELILNASTTSDQLRATNRSDLAVGLEKHISALKNLSASLVNVTKPDELKLLEQRLKDLETELKAELQRVAQLQTAIKDLVAKIDALTTKAKSGSKTLSDAGKTAESQEVNKQVDRLDLLKTEALVASSQLELSAFTDELAQIEKLVNQLTAA